ncbi:glycosyltransferase [Enterococcus malodoratus]|uniref:Glycosyl transferase family 1 domain-containing protein n=1 Tax=Enterococcus malodoratus ATCC 43197 TaxID=1158601 RepID=R2NZK7_9ENTE|nr:glycosyltransferase [Enterococcus malodoratus]EOH77457.1 hypothetical protein UAI_02094 [Enterococcus malodoratus ATCC 43197]EOT64129.1 hypothetical protein I585_03326 [Enterococcus malodoratus ATCC 43197]OJG64323.1 hypothetical protein RV07_GL004296 [Enterococcus malodoratus]SPX00866.1 group 1 glycosyl transferase [Enterococcus malodoratus]STD66185.1 group 1 glycosyl transferase [Enterococcus malodoratus]
MKKQRLLFFIYDLSGGGAEKLLVNILNNIDLKNFDVEVKLLFYQGVNIKEINSEVKVSYVFKKKITGFRVITKLISPKLLFKGLIKGEYDIIVSFFEGVTTRIVSGCEQKRCKLLNWVHISFDDFSNQCKVYRNKKELINCYKRYDATICVANSVRKSFLANVPEISQNKVKIIYNFMDIDNILEKSNEKLNYFDSNYFNLISIGRFIEQKGYDRLIPIISNLKSNIKTPFRMYIFGNGEDRKKFEKLILQLKLEDTVFLEEYTENPYKYIKNADLFVCSSRKEGYSTVISESILLETPVVSTDCSGVREQLGEDEYGIISKNNSFDLEEKIELIISNESLYHELKERMPDGAEKIRKRVSITNFENLFEEVNK